MITTANDGTKTVWCGFGTVGTAEVKLGGSVVLLISEIPKTYIGSTNWEMTEEHQVELRFHNVEAVDAWINNLESVKAALQGRVL